MAFDRVLQSAQIFAVVAAFITSLATGFSPLPKNRIPTKISSYSDDGFMESLRSRMDQVTDKATKLPLVILDSMLPRQVLEIQVQNKVLIDLVKSRLEAENPYFGMLGKARLSTGEQVHLHKGVEVKIGENPVFVDGGLRLKLVAGRRFVIEGEVDNVEQGWTEGRVKFFDSAQDEETEVQGNDRMAVARAMSKAREFTSPNPNMEQNKSLVNRWIELAKENERQPGQIDKLLLDLGEIPPSEEPTERALWVGALINPIPAMGVAMEIRPALLTASTAEKRVQVALDGILRSIKHMDGSARMW